MSGVFSRTAGRVTAAWAIGLVALLVVSFLVAQFSVAEHLLGGLTGSLAWPWEAAWCISIASGIVSIAALLPGWCLGRFSTSDFSAHDNAGRGQRAAIASIGTTAALAIRFVGTVALFVACRYHFGVAASTTVAFLVLGWYVLLTVVEVQCLAAELASLDHGDPGASAGPTEPPADLRRGQRRPANQDPAGRQLGEQSPRLRRGEDSVAVDWVAAAEPFNPPVEQIRTTR